jgi:hypothetical protein
MRSHLPSGDSPAVVFATTANGLRLPVIDVTHPAFSVPDDHASLKARRDVFLGPSHGWLRGAPCCSGRSILASDNDYLDSIGLHPIS